jgi:hypothetical protein
MMVERVADIFWPPIVAPGNATPLAQALVERHRVLIDRRTLTIPGAIGLTQAE